MAKKTSKESVQDWMTRDWFVLRGKKKVGPYAGFEIAQLLQKGEVFEFDYVWTKGFDQWKKVAECKEFRAESLNEIPLFSDEETKQNFFRRRHCRVSHSSSVIIHDNDTVFYGESLDMSSMGARLKLSDGLQRPWPVGSKLYLHFRPDAELPAFNAICEVRHLPEKDVLGVQFVSIGREARKCLKNFIQEQRSA